MRWVLYIVAGLAGLVALVAIVGWMLPRDHVATVSATVPAPPGDVWAAIADPAGFPAWRPDVARVEVLPATAEGPSWREHSKDGAITYVAERSEPPQLLVARIANRDLPFGGRWEYRLAPDSAGTRITITEHGEVYNPIFRFVSRFVMGHTATMDAYLRALQTRFAATRTAHGV